MNFIVKQDKLPKLSMHVTVRICDIISSSESVNEYNLTSFCILVAADKYVSSSDSVSS